MKKTLTALPIAALLAVSLASCATPATGISDTSSAAASGAAAGGAVQPSTSQAEENAEPEAVEDDGTAEFGDTYSWEDGIAVTVVDAGKYRSSESAYTQGSGPFRKYKITIENGSEEPFDASGVQVSLSSGDEEQDAVIDVTSKIGIKPERTLRAGKKVSYTEAFSVPNRSDVTLEVAPDFEHAAVLYVKEG